MMFTPEVIITLVFCCVVSVFCISDLVVTMRKLARAAGDNTYQPQPSVRVIREESGRSTVVVKDINNEDAEELLRIFTEGRELRNLDVSSGRS
jgi:hypothetical protein